MQGTHRGSEYFISFHLLKFPEVVNNIPFYEESETLGGEDLAQSHGGKQVSTTPHCLLPLGGMGFISLMRVLFYADLSSSPDSGPLD